MLSPSTKKVAGTCSARSSWASSAVRGPGPSSKVNATQPAGSCGVPDSTHALSISPPVHHQPKYGLRKPVIRADHDRSPAELVDALGFLKDQVVNVAVAAVDDDVGSIHKACFGT